MEDEEAILGVALGFEDATATNMGGRRAVVQERGADHQEAMALQGIFFGTHEGSDVGLGEGEGAIDAFGEIRGLNVVVDPSIQGTVNVHFHNVPWDQAFDFVLRTNKLGSVVDGSTLRITPATDTQGPPRRAARTLPEPRQVNQRPVGEELGPIRDLWPQGGNGLLW